MRSFTFVLFTAAVFSLTVTGLAQDCSPPKIVANNSSGNMFSPEQEMILGDLSYQRLSREFRLVKDTRLQEYLNSIGARLMRHLPETGLKFQFLLIDYPEANAFNIAGGRIFVSRKLVSFVQSEDELASVLAHELGHAAVRHNASDVSDAMKRLLNITSVSDRKDITEKYNLMIENARMKKAPARRGHENEQQVEADKIGIFAMVSAGYDVGAMYTFFDRLTEAEGKTGNWFSDLFGNTSPDQKRLQKMAQLAGELPVACRDTKTAKETESFKKWQADVVSFRDESTDESLPGLLWKKELSPKLRSDVRRMLASRDGRYIVTRDDSGITIFDREPLRVHFQIPVENVDDLYITPDGKQVVFTTTSLRFERWDIAEKKALEAREVVIRRDCVESRLSPDGNFLACIDTSASANLIDLRSGKRIYQKKDFYRLNYYEYRSWVWDLSSTRDRNFFRIEFTPDSKTLVYSRSNYYRTYSNSLSVGSRYASYNEVLAIDVASLKPVDLGKEIANVTARAYAFLDANRIVGMSGSEPTESGIFSFPEGKRLQKFAFFATDIKPTGSPDHFIIRPLKDSRIGVFDAKSMGLVAGIDKEDATVWKDLFYFESASGQLVARQLIGTGKETKIGEKDVASIDIPVSRIGYLNAAQISNNFNWLAISANTRGGVWSLANGERKVYSPGFRGGIVADDGGAIAEFPKLGNEKHALVLLNPMSGQLGVIRDLPEAGARQFGRFVLQRSGIAATNNSETSEKGKDAEKDASDSSIAVYEDPSAFLFENVRFELKDFIQDKVIWTRDFPKDVPGYSFDSFSGRLVLYWTLASETGKAKLKENPELQARAAALGNKDGDYLIEVVDAFAGKTVGTIFVETGKGSFHLTSGISENDWLVLFDSHGRVMIYSIKSGELRHRFFGNYASINPVRNQIAVENFPGEISIYDLATGDVRSTYLIKGGASLIRFNLQGNSLFVLSDLQRAYAFDLNKLSVTSSIP